MRSLNTGTTHFFMAAALALVAISFTHSPKSESADFASSIDDIQKCVTDAKAKGSGECTVGSEKTTSKKQKVETKVKISVNKDNQLEATVTSVAQCISCGTTKEESALLNDKDGNVVNLANAIKEKAALTKTKALKEITKDLKAHNDEENCKVDGDGEKYAKEDDQDRLDCLHDKMEAKDDEKAKKRYFEENIRPLIDARLKDPTDAMAPFYAQALLAKFGDISTEGNLAVEMKALNATIAIKLAPQAHAREVSGIEANFKMQLANVKGDKNARQALMTQHQQALAVADQKYAAQETSYRTQLSTMATDKSVILDAGLASSIGMSITALDANDKAFQADLDARKAKHVHNKAGKNTDAADDADFDKRMGRLTRETKNEDGKGVDFCKDGNTCYAVKLIPMAAGKNGAPAAQQKTATPAQKSTSTNLGANSRTTAI